MTTRSPAYDSPGSTCNPAPPGYPGTAAQGLDIAEPEPETCCDVSGVQGRVISFINVENSEHHRGARGENKALQIIGALWRTKP